MTSSTNTLVFTDLDGTLIDHNTYSWKDAEPAINKLKVAKIPIIPCTSKTRTEIDFYRKKIGLGDPLISENGGAIFVPKGYFDSEYDYDKELDDYNVIELGRPYGDIRGTLDEMRSFGNIVGFGDMSVEEVAKDTGLSLEEAKMAKEREYDEAFRFNGDEEGLKRAIEKAGLSWTRGGRYWHIMGDNDKGKAVGILSKLYGNCKTIGLGDSLNDLPMLKAVDTPIVVRKPDNSYDKGIDLPDLIKAGGIGPVGWNKAILGLRL
jgi:mannosyl-3-phosphoglycerate phosphatase